MDDLRGMGDAELIDAYTQAYMARHSDRWIGDVSPLRDELLRRLSAGNPQAEKVQISDLTSVSGVTGEAAQNVTPHGDGWTYSEPERSDGRILGQLGMRSGDAVARYAPTSDGRIRGEDLQHSPGLARGFTLPKPCCAKAGTPHTYDQCQAQRSVGRVEAGSEQECGHFPVCRSEAECANVRPFYDRLV